MHSLVSPATAPAARPTGSSLVERRVRESVELQGRLLEPDLRDAIAAAAATVAASMRAGGKLLLFGNGGSAADAQHIAAEFVGRYLRDRQALAAIALTTDSSALTAVANDYSYDSVFARQVEALCGLGDVVIAISTSGGSRNVLAGVAAAHERGATTIGLTGGGGSELRAACDQCICFPSSDTPRIQEGHTLIGHVICEIVEGELATSA
jgi:D-sedoheptulose 7-phosphate isomerase